ncbi:MAG: hypothetical protein QXW18_00045 [Candidatus Bathyarchaeia archaeon]
MSYKNLRKQTASYLLLAFMIGVAMALEAVLLFINPAPPGSDPALRIWSTRRLVLLGETREPYPAFDVSLACIWLIGFDVNDLCIWFGIVLSALTVIPAFLLARNIWKGSVAGYIAAFLTAFSFAIFEMISWGGYANLLAVWYILLITAFLTRSPTGDFRRKLLTLTILNAGLMMSHFWSFLVYIAVVTVAAFTMTGLQKWLNLPKGTRLPLTILASIPLTILITSPWWVPIHEFLMTVFGIAFGSTSVVMRMGDSGYFWYFLQPSDFFMTFIIIGFAVIFIKARKGGLDFCHGLILLTLFVVPLALTQAYHLGVTIDYKRLYYYPVLASLIATAIGLVFVLTLPLKVKIRHQTIHKIVHVITPPTIVAVLLYFIIGVNTIAVGHFFQATVYYQTIRGSEYGAITWIGAKTSSSAIIATGASMGWWVNGLTGRDAVVAMPLSFVSIPWQVPRVTAANLILSNATRTLDNEIMRVEEAGPNWILYNPMFIHTERGAYTPVLFFNNRLIRIDLNEESYSLSSFAHREVGWEYRDANQAILKEIFQNYNPNVSVVKRIIFYRGSRFVEVNYHIEAASGISLKSLRIWAYPPANMNYTDLFTDLMAGKIRKSFVRWVGFLDPVKRTCVSIITDERMLVKASTQPNGALAALSMKVYPSSGNIIDATFYVGAFQVTDEDSARSYLNTVSKSPTQSVLGVTSPVKTQDYLDAIRTFGVDYILTREDIANKFQVDSHTNLVYCNGKIFTFRVIQV